MTRITDGLPDLELISRELERCGWSRASVGSFDGELLFQSGQRSVRAPGALFQPSRGGEPLLLVDFGSAFLTGHEELYTRFLDFSIETRMALSAATLLASAGHLLLLSEGKVELFRLPEETLEYRVTTPREYEEELLPALVSRARQKGGTLAALPNAPEAAGSLRGWLAHWSRTLSDPVGAPSADCEKFLWKIILMLQAARKTGQGEMAGGWGLQCEKLDSIWSLSYDTLSTHDDLARALEEFDQTFSSRIFSGDAELHRGWLSAVEEGSLMEQLRAELLMQSQFKFAAESVAWLHTSMESEQRGWQLEVRGIEPIRRRISASQWSVLTPLTCDVGRYGLSHALRETERLAQHWTDQAIYLRAAAEKAEASFSQPDLFHAAPRGIGPRNQLDDGVNFLFSESLRLSGVPAGGEFDVGITFLLKALDLVKRLEWPFFGVDTLDRLWSTPEA